MIQSAISGISPPTASTVGKGTGAATPDPERSDVGKRFEQMLWAEMLSHAGLEKSFTLGGGESASAFSRFIVEAIAEDLAETRPLGLAEKVDEVIAQRSGMAPASAKGGE